MNSFVLYPWQNFFFRKFRQVFDNPNLQVMTVLARRQVMHKSGSGLICALHALSNSDHALYGWFSPSYKQSRKQFDELKRWYELFNLHCTLEFNESKLIITCTNTSSKLYFYSLGNPDNIRGETLSGAFVDEAAFCSDAAISIVFPMLDVHKGWMVLLSTPWKKSGVFYKLFIDPHTIVEDWTTYPLEQVTTPERIEFYRRTLLPNLFKTDILGQFLEDSESLLYGDIKDCIEESPSYNGEPISIGIDWSIAKNDFVSVSGVYQDSNNIIHELFTTHFCNGRHNDIVGTVFEILKPYLPYIKVIMSESNNVGSVLEQELEDLLRSKGYIQLANSLQSDWWSSSSKGKAVSRCVLLFNLKQLRVSSALQLKETSEYTQITSKSGSITFGNINQGNRDFHDDAHCAFLHALSGLSEMNTVLVR